MYKLLVVSAFLGLAACAPAPDSDSREGGGRGYGRVRSYGSDEYDAPAYKFVWGVKDDESYNDFGHEESRYGDKTEGRYHVLLPDGRRQIVTYRVDGDSGYVANVEYEGEARYDDKGYYSKKVAIDSDSHERIVYKPKPKKVTYVLRPRY